MYLYRLLPKLCPRLSDFSSDGRDGSTAAECQIRISLREDEREGPGETGDRGIRDTLLAVFLELETLIL